MAKTKSFEDNMLRLQQIVDLLNSNNTPMDEALKLFEEGLECVKSCDNQLKTFESKYNELYDSQQGDTNE